MAAHRRRVVGLYLSSVTAFALTDLTPVLPPDGQLFATLSATWWAGYLPALDSILAGSVTAAVFAKLRILD
ncbi:MAG: hypothetical protein Q4A71_05325 [Actinomycetaceae bacterium]|nr:hypothetical protein [Actinomycetaceae bacterium]